MPASLEFPPWVDPETSRSLPEIRARGEGPNVEFKSAFPTNTAVLGKTIAAFASSDGGTIYVGVGDDGDLIGLPEALDPQGRDGLVQRIEGICSGPIRPAVRALVKWALENEKVVMVVGVPRGSQPMYYHANIPYVRHLTSSRPADPQEIIDHVLGRYSTLVQPQLVGGAQTQEDEIDAWVGELANALLPVLIYSEEIEPRLIDPWLTMWMAEYKGAAESLRELLLGGNAPSDAKSVIESLIPKLEKISRFRMYIGCGQELVGLASEAANDARKLWHHHVDPNLAGNREELLRTVVKRAGAKLEDLCARGRDLLFSGESGEFQSAVSSIGREVLRVAYLALGTANVAHAPLFLAARGLHLIETVRLYLDGGQSQERLLSSVIEMQDALVKAAAKLNQ